MAGSHTIGAGTTISAGYTISSSAFTLVNDGVAGSTAAKYGVFSSFAGDTVANFGNILGLASSGVGVRLNDGGLVQNQSGAIRGAYAGIIVAGAAGTVTNQGSIGGAALGARLIQGGSVYNASTGTITGNYDVVISSGSGLVTNAGKIEGIGIGVALEAGGNVTVATGGTISGALAVQVTGGTGDVYNHGVIEATGGASGTAITLPAGFSNLLSVFSGSTIVGTVSGGNTVGGTAASNLNLYGGSGTGTITGLGSKYIGFKYYYVSTGDWVLTGTNTLEVGAQLNVASTLTNSGAVQGGVQLENFAAYPSLTNAFGAVLTGSTFGVRGTNGPVGVVNDGLITATSTSGNGIQLDGGGSVSNQSAGTISGGYDGILVHGAAGTIVNQGRVMGAGIYSYGMRLDSGGVVTNGASAYIFGEIQGIYAKLAGTATITNQGTISGQTDGVMLGGGGTFTNVGTAARVISGGIGVLAFHVPASVSNQGTIKGSEGVGLSAGGTLLNAGTIIGIGFDAVKFNLGYTNLLVVDPGAVFSGTVDGGNTIGATAVSTLELATGASAGTLSGLGSSYVNFGSIAFDAGASWFIAGNTPGLAGTISGFAPGDTIEVTGITVTGSNFAGGVLTLDEASGSATLALTGSFTTPSFIVTNVAGGAEVRLACFRAGTRIATTEGEVPVESLAVGDRTRTLIGMDAAPIVWIGHRRIDCRRHPEVHRVWPVRIARGTFGAGRPRRDLWVSPDHAVFVNDVLIPVKMLINGTTIVQVAVDEVTYYHVELPRHDVLLAEGLAVESYLETGDRANFDNGDSVRLFPDFASHSWEARGCAPLIVAGPALEAVARACRRGGPPSRRDAGAARSA